MLRMIRIIPIPSLQLFPNLVVETGKAADDDVWGWDGMGAEHMFSKQDGEREGKTEVCGTFQMQICHERTLGRRRRWREVIGFANASTTTKAQVTVSTSHF